VNIFQSSTPLGRLLFGVGVFGAAIMVRQFLPALLLLLISLVVLRLATGSWDACRNAWRVLRWLLAPIVLLHFIFTPGTIIVPQLGGPSYEAVNAALWLSIRLSLMFVAAMVFSRMLQPREWAQALLAMPWAGQRLYPYVRLLFPMRASLERLVRSYYRHWRIRRRRFSAADLAALFSGLFTQVMEWSRRQGGMLWLRWGIQERGGFDAAMDGKSWLLALSGGLWCLLAAWVL